MPLLENGAYLDRLLMFKGTISEADFARSAPGETPPETAIRDYGLGMAALWRGDAARARRTSASNEGRAFRAAATKSALPSIGCRS